MFPWPPDAVKSNLAAQLTSHALVIPAIVAYLPEGGASSADIARIPCLLYTSDAADERSSVDLGGRRIIKKK